MTIVPNVSKGNDKLGNIPSFSLPSIQTCPYSTSICRRLCYAAKLERIYPNVKKAYSHNLAASSDPLFVQNMIKAIGKSKVFRIHVSGDFYSVDYIQAWDVIISECPNTMFYAYTRSWQGMDLLPALESLKENKNLVILASVDAETGFDVPQGWRMATMGEQPVKTVSCPQQTKKALSCEACKLCFNPKTSANIEFAIH